MDFRYVAGSLVIIVGLAGCVQTRELNDYAKNSLTTVQQIDKATRAYVRNCKEVKPDPVKTTNNNCRRVETAAKTTRALSKVVIGYFEYLQDLSNDSVVSHQKNSRRLALQVKNLPAIKSEVEHKRRVDAAQKLLSLILTGASDRARRQTLQQTMRQANEPLNRIMHTLRDVVAKNYRLGLDIQQARILADLRAKRRRYAKSEPLALQMYRQQQQAKLHSLRSQKGVLSRLGKSIELLIKAHDRLAKQQGSNTSTDMKALLEQYARQVNLLVDAMKKL